VTEGVSSQNDQGGILKDKAGFIGDGQPMAGHRGGVVFDRAARVWGCSRVSAQRPL
jgi:hypothetical protein